MLYTPSKPSLIKTAIIGLKKTFAERSVAKVVGSGFDPRDDGAKHLNIKDEATGNVSSVLEVNFNSFAEMPKEGDQLIRLRSRSGEDLGYCRPGVRDRLSVSLKN